MLSFYLFAFNARQIKFINHRNVIKSTIRLKAETSKEEQLKYEFHAFAFIISKKIYEYLALLLGSFYITSLF